MLSASNALSMSLPSATKERADRDGDILDVVDHLFDHVHDAVDHILQAPRRSTCPHSITNFGHRPCGLFDRLLDGLPTPSSAS